MYIMYRILICDDLHHIINISIYLYIYIHTLSWFIHNLISILFSGKTNFTMENHHAIHGKMVPLFRLGHLQLRWIRDTNHLTLRQHPCHRRHRWSADNMRIPASHEAEKKRRSNRGIYWCTWDHRIWLFNICYSIFIYTYWDGIIYNNLY